ncbi:MAG: fatty acyl-AMP ligase, partial [Thermoanaerobaculia bacterium]|nr:fatty acyl-AMP ligase [Thermoanaerobaculia bacterium]
MQVSRHPASLDPRDRFESLVDVLRGRAEAQAHAELFSILRDDGEVAETLSYRALDRRACAIAAALRQRFQPGERALLLFPVGVDFIAAFFGCLYAGLVAVPAYPPRLRRGNPQLSAIIGDCSPATVLTNAANLERFRATVDPLVSGRELAWIAVDQVDEPAADPWRGPALDPNTLAFVQYTSGSTSTPKGVMVSHANLIDNERAIYNAFGMSSDAVVVGWLPLYHDMGLIGNVLQPLFAGARCVLMSPAAFLQNPRRWLEAISRFRGTTSGGPNFAYEHCVRAIAPEQRLGLDLSSWRVAFNGAEPVHAATLERFAAAFAGCGFRREAFLPCYGLAEATLFVTGGALDSAVSPVEFSNGELERHHAAVPAVDADRRGLL